MTSHITRDITFIQIIFNVNLFLQSPQIQLISSAMASLLSNNSIPIYYQKPQLKSLQTIF